MSLGGDIDDASVVAEETVEDVSTVEAEAQDEEEEEETEEEPAEEEETEAEPVEETVEEEPAEDEGDAAVSAQATTYVYGDWSYTVSNEEATITAYAGSDLDIVIPDTLEGYTVTSIGSGVCSKTDITSVTIPVNVTSISSGAFYNCTKLTKITINAKELDDRSRGGENFYNAGAEADSLTVIFGSTVKTIPAYLFYVYDADYYYGEGHYAHITNVVIPDNVTSIGKGAFQNCYDLASVSLGSGITSIGDYAFSRTAITSLTIPSGTTSLGEGAFYDCEKLAEITINAKSLKSCSSDTFWNAGADVDSLEVTFGSTVKKIPENLFYSTNKYSYCTHITSVTIASSVESIGRRAFQNCCDLETVTFMGDSITFTDEDTFLNCPFSLTFKCYYGSTAATFATENGFKVRYHTPATPTISSVSNTTSGVKLSWGKVSYTAGYYIYRKTGASGTYSKIKTISGNTTVSWTDTSVSSGKTYYYCVKAYAGSSVSSASAAKSIKYLTAGKVSSLTNTSSGITVKWSKVTGASGYKIYRKTSGGSYSLIKTVTSGSTVSYTDTAVKSKNGTTYVYAVRPYSGSYMGSYTGKTTARLTGVSISSLTNVKTKKMTVKWGKNTKSTGYQIQYSTSSSFSSGNKTVTVSGSTSVSKTISSLTKGKKYYVRVRAYKTVSGTKYYSAWSSTKNVKISK